MPTLVPRWIVVVLFAWIALRLPAQCNNTWVPGDPFPGVNGAVQAMKMWDPDGAGPLQPRLVVGGSFNAAGATAATGLAMWDPTTGTWSPLGDVLGTVFAMAVMPNGDLIVAGNFTHVAGVSAACIARYDGTSWSPLGAGMNGPVLALAVMPNGDLFAGGNFLVAGTVGADRIARWDGTTWHVVGPGVNGTVRSLGVRPNGELVAGGDFTVAGFVGASYIARWNGTSWTVISGTSLTGPVYSITVLGNGDVVAGGLFTTAGMNRIGRWNGSSWSPMGSGTSGLVTGVLALTGGDVLAIGAFTSAGGTSVQRVARWNGAGWSALGSGIGSVPTGAAVELPNGSLMIGLLGTPGVRRWDGTAWSTLGTGFDGSVSAIAVAPNGDLIVGGSFLTAPGVAANRIARWDGVAWSPLGDGMNGTVNALAFRANGEIVAGGSFTVAGTVGASYVARWDGANWAVLNGVALNGPVSALAALPNGDIVAAGGFHTPGANVARWNGVGWSPVGSGVPGTPVCMVTLPNGDLVVGVFSVSGFEGAWRWDGSSWSLLGGWWYSGYAGALAVLPNGDLAATFGESDLGIWNGSAWSWPGSVDGVVSDLLVLPNGDLLVAGFFTGGYSYATGLSTPSANAIRWHHNDWLPMVGIQGSGAVEDLDVLPNGDVMVGGGAFYTSGVFSSGLVRLTTSCPATASTWGLGCPSSGGANTIVAATLPWVESTLRVTGTGLPATAVALTMTSLTSFPQGVVPLSIAFANTGPGCDLLVAPDITGLLFTTTGNASSDLFLPNTPPLVGVAFHHQWLVLDLGPADQVTATNALQLTAGAF
ncbi:MAG: hypothetical protein JNK78_13540 [Planctomycetes bacterium]|nr:hypothetical protein [Planctomycetota bacterium]